MDYQNQKLELIDWIVSLEDSSILDKIIILKNSTHKVDWNTISVNEKNSIKLGLKDAEDGKLNPHSEAQKLYKKWI